MLEHEPPAWIQEVQVAMETQMLVPDPARGIHLAVNINKLRLCVFTVIISTGQIWKLVYEPKDVLFN